MAKPFKDLYIETDLDGNELDWEWDPDLFAFTATDDNGTEYTLRPTFGEIITSEVEKEDEEEEEV